MQAKLYDKKTFVSFLRNNILIGPNQAPTGYQYIAKVLGMCRDEQDHERSRARLEREKTFLEMVHVDAVPHCDRGHPPAQQADYRVSLVDNLDLPAFPSDPISTLPNPLTGFGVQNPYHDNGEALPAANQNMAMFPNVHNTLAFPPPLPPFMGHNAYQEASQNGAWPQHHHTNLPSQNSDSAYHSIPGPIQGPAYEQPSQDECILDPQMRIHLRDAALLYVSSGQGTVDSTPGKPHGAQ